MLCAIFKEHKWPDMAKVQDVWDEDDSRRVYCIMGLYI